jgi:hypothetical protein
MQPSRVEPAKLRSAASLTAVGIGRLRREVFGERALGGGPDCARTERKTNRFTPARRAARARWIVASVLSIR